MDIVGVLEEAQRRGFVGRGPLEPHLAHARAFAAAVGRMPGRGLDLGSGGGLPGLVLASVWPASRWVLLEAQQRRGDHLRWAVGELGLVDRVTVDRRRAEDAGRDPALRATIDVVVSRSFGPPAVVAECAAPLLQPGGLLVVSEPPEASDRWPADELEVLGLIPDPEQVPGFMRLRQVEPVPERFPRRAGIPAKRPLF
jgi:16S rRNA (guanine527-N7)-methyltransferase